MVTQSATVGGSLWVLGNQTIAGSLGVAGFSSSANSTVTGSFVVTQSATVGGSLRVAGSQTIVGSLGVAGFNSSANSTITGSLVVTQSATIGGSLWVAGSQTIVGSLGVAGFSSSADSTVTGSLSVTQSATIGGSLRVAGSQTIAGSLGVVSSVDATNTATGALQVTGGIGIGGNVFAGGRVNIASGTTQAVTSTTNPTYAIVGGFINGSTANTIFTYDGTTWTGRGSSVFTNNCNHAYWNGTIWVGAGAGTNTIATSTDGGITWTPRTASMFTEVRRVVWASSLNLWVALGDGTTRIATSSDNGNTWVGRATSIFSQYGFAVDWNGTTFIAAGTGGNSIATSTDGINWTGRGTAMAPDLGSNSMYWSASLNLWIAGRFSANPPLMTSTDNGITWANVTGGYYNTSIAWDGTRFISGSSGNGSTYTSTNGTTWTSTGTSPTMSLVSAMGYINGKWVAVGQGSSNNTVSISTDNGATWTGLGVTIFAVAGSGFAYNSASTTTQVVSIIDSTNTATGGLQVLGGVGIGGNVYAGGSLSVTQSATVGGSLWVIGSQTIAGSLGVAGFGSTANSTITGSLVVTQNATVGGSLRVAGSQTIAGSLIIASSTNVGTSTTTGALQVAGGARIGGDIRLGGSGGSIIIDNSLTTATRLGYNAGKSTGFTPFAGSFTYGDVTAIGYNVMPNGLGCSYSYSSILGGYTTARPTTAIGSNALESLVYGGTIVAIGYNAGRYMKFTTGSSDGTTYGVGYNTAIGDYSQQGQDIGNVNSGINNTSLGYTTLYNNSTGTSNTAVGYSALFSNTTGGNNIATGYLALYANTTGSYNVATGTQALQSNTTGTFNVGIGYQAGTTIATGTLNTCIGSSTNVTVGNIQNSTCIGYNASANASNLVILGNSSITALRCQVQTITALSDRRDKKDIRDLEMGMNFVKALRPVRFVWNMRDGGKVDIQEIGFIAQEVIEAGGRQIPNLVDETDEDKLLVGQMAMFPVVVKAVQELNTQLNTANATIAEQGKLIQQLFEEIAIMKAMISKPI